MSFKRQHHGRCWPGRDPLFSSRCLVATLISRESVAVRRQKLAKKGLYSSRRPQFLSVSIVMRSAQKHARREQSAMISAALNRMRMRQKFSTSRLSKVIFTVRNEITTGKPWTLIACKKTDWEKREIAATAISSAWYRQRTSDMTCKW